MDTNAHESNKFLIRVHSCPFVAVSSETHPMIVGFVLPELVAAETEDFSTRLKPPRRHYTRSEDPR